MSSKMMIDRICQFCGSTFTARTTVTRTCSDACAKKLYKQKQREAKIEQSNKETQRVLAKPMEEIKSKEFLTVKDAAKLLNCSLRTTYRLIENGSIKGVNISERKTLIKRSDIDKLFA